MYTKKLPVLLMAIMLSLMVVEGFVRFSAPYLSENIHQINMIPQTVNWLNVRGKNQKESIIFMGNSLMANAIDEEKLARSISEQGAANNVVAYKIVPDATNLWDWYCITKTHGTELRSNNLLIVGFAWDQLEDNQNILASRIAGHFCALSDLPDLMHLGMSTPSMVFEYLVASFSRMYSLRETIQKRLLVKIIPNYEIYTQEINRYSRQNGPDDVSTKNDRDKYLLLSRFINFYSEKGIKVVFVAMPVVNKYAVDKELAAAIENNGAVLYDYRSMEGITPGMFIDPIHLGDVGRAVFTNRMLKDLSRIIPE